MKKLFTFVAILFVAITMNAQQIGIQAGLGIPTGDFKDLTKAKLGFGGVATYFYQMSEIPVLFTGSVGYYTFKTDEITAPAPLVGTLSQTISFVPIQVGARYSFMKEGFMPYVMAEVGYSIGNSSVDGTGIFASGSSSTDIGSHASISPGLGFMYKMGTNINLDVNAKYNMIFDSGSTLSYVGVNAGVVFGL